MSLSLCAPETQPSSIRRLIASNALTAVFQPIVRFADGEIIGYEGLIRGPAGSGLESPAALFEQAAREKQSIALEQAAARACIAAFARLARAGLLFINFSAPAIESGITECETPGDLARESGLDTKRLVVELTEQSVIADADRFGESVRALRASGSQFALDDYGSANASMNLWVRFAPHYVKIDRFFVADIVRDLGIACAQGYLLGGLPRYPMCICPNRSRTRCARGRYRFIGRARERTQPPT